MAAPTAPTADSIVTEAMKKAKFGDSKVSDNLTRAKDEWLEEVKNDIWIMNKQFSALLKYAVTVTRKGQSQYDNPSDFAAPHTLWRLYGQTTGTAQGGSVNTIQLAANNTKDPVGLEILITSGTGVKSIARAITYNSSTKWVDVSPQFNSAVASGSGYMIIESEKELDREIVDRIFDFSTSRSMGDPDIVYYSGDESYGKFDLEDIPDKVYGLRKYYYANLIKLDLTSTTLKTTYERWRSLYVQGVFYKALQSRRDSDSEKEKTAFFRMLNSLIAHEKPEHQNSDLQIRLARD